MTPARTIERVIELDVHENVTAEPYKLTVDDEGRVVMFTNDCDSYEEACNRARCLPITESDVETWAYYRTACPKLARALVIAINALRCELLGVQGQKVSCLKNDPVADETWCSNCAATAAIEKIFAEEG